MLVITNVMIFKGSNLTLLQES